MNAHYNASTADPKLRGRWKKVASLFLSQCVEQTMSHLLYSILFCFVSSRPNAFQNKTTYWFVYCGFFNFSNGHMSSACILFSIFAYRFMHLFCLTTATETIVFNYVDMAIFNCIQIDSCCNFHSWIAIQSSNHFQWACCCCIFSCTLVSLISILWIKSLIWCEMNVQENALFSKL